MWSRLILRRILRENTHHQHGRLTEIAWEVLAIVVVFQLHVVVIDHAAGGDAGAFTVEDQIQRRLAGIQPFQLLSRCSSRRSGHIVPAANVLQIGKVCDDPGLLTPEGQVD